MNALPMIASAQKEALPLQRLRPLDARIPRWDKADLLERNCPICQRKGSACFVRPDDLTVNECEGCGAWYVAPAPSKAQLQRFYVEYSRKHQRLPDLPPAAQAQRILKASYADNIVIQELLALDAIKGKRCLDVGFGRGKFLARLQQLGGLTAGIELDPAAIRFAQQYLGINEVRLSALDELPAHETYDLLLLLDFVEHPLDIMPLLAKAVSLLNRAGLLTIWTPNASRVWQQEEPVLFRVDLEHMQYFSLQTCNFVANRLGLSLVHLESCGFPDLAGIEATPAQNKRRSYANWLPEPLIKTAYRARRWWRNSLGQSAYDPYRQIRLGNYHLFCIFEKSG